MRTVSGSSPRLRGTLLRCSNDRRNLRFIPAPAGNTGPYVLDGHCAPVHPRACGEHVNEIIALVRQIGSSPRLRGTQLMASGAIGRFWFIPAPAGNTRSIRDICLGRAVHPRACGEHEEEGEGLVGQDGSSPRLRGTRQPGGRALPEIRFIPAPAGNTRRSIFTCCAAGGSSPRLRGTQELGGFIAVEARFIPAPAGNTFDSMGEEAFQEVHPRACGEHLSTN